MEVSQNLTEPDGRLSELERIDSPPDEHPVGCGCLDCFYEKLRTAEEGA